MFSDTLLDAVGATLGAKNESQMPFWRQRPRVAPPATGRCGPARDPASHLLVMMDDNAEIMIAPQVAELLQVSPRTLQDWRQTRTGPTYRRMGRHVRYLRGEVLSWFAALATNA